MNKDIFGIFMVLPLIMIFLFPAGASSDVIVHDAVALAGKEVMLTAETEGRLFPQGGKVVEFFVDKKSLGKNLSGGDGVAFRSFTPPRTGVYHISAKSGEEEGSGILLILRKGQRIIFVEVEGALMEDIFSEKPRNGSREMLGRLSARFPIVLLQTGLTGAPFTKRWLKENGFTSYPVLPWEEGSVFDELSEKGLKIKAVIGKGPVIDSVKGFGAKAFSFEEVEGAEEVDSWGQIGKKLR